MVFALSWQNGDFPSPVASPHGLVLDIVLLTGALLSPVLSVGVDSQIPGFFFRGGGGDL